MGENRKRAYHTFPMSQLYLVFNTSTLSKHIVQLQRITEKLSPLHYENPSRGNPEVNYGDVIECNWATCVGRLEASRMKVNGYVVCKVCCCLSAISKLDQAICLSPQCSLKPLWLVRRDVGS